MRHRSRKIADFLFAALFITSVITFVLIVYIETDINPTPLVESPKPPSEYDESEVQIKKASDKR